MNMGCRVRWGGYELIVCSLMAETKGTTIPHKHRRTQITHLFLNFPDNKPRLVCMGCYSKWWSLKGHLCLDRFGSQMQNHLVTLSFAEADERTEVYPEIHWLFYVEFERNTPLRWFYLLDN